MELTTARLRLRPFTAADEEAIHAVYCDPEVMRHVGNGPHRTIDDTTTALRIYGDVLARYGYSFLAVCELDRGVLIGDGGLYPLGGQGPDIELGYTLARSAWGKGYATELGRALVDHAFAVLHAPRVVAQVEPPNRASRHVLEKLGFTERQMRTAYGRPHAFYVTEAKRPAAPPEQSPQR
jgi:[ribosomal protein S5]-alanine N-acetyltransferase